MGKHRVCNAGIAGSSPVGSIMANKIGKASCVGVEISSHMLWVVKVRDQKVPKGQAAVGEKPVHILLEWGWTTGMTEKEIAKLADDCPKGHEILRLSLSTARELHKNLGEILKKHKKKPKKPRSYTKTERLQIAMAWRLGAIANGDDA